MKYEKSCGVIIVNGQEVLLIKSINNDWGFPKGHMEDRETEIATALREVKEETNLDVEIIKGKRYMISYQPKENIHKDAIYFVGILKNENIVKLQESEILEYRWVRMDQVDNFLAFADLKEIYQKALQDIILDSKRIKYVKVSKEFINDYLEMVNNPKISQYISSKERIISYEDEEKYIEDKINNQDLIFTMIDKETNKFIGNVELKDKTEKSLEIGLCITEDFQNQHYGYETLKTIIDYAFQVLDLEEVLLSYYSNNAMGKHLYEKLGFKTYEIIKNCFVRNNQSIDDVYMKITKDEYNELY